MLTGLRRRGSSWFKQPFEIVGKGHSKEIYEFWLLQAAALFKEQAYTYGWLLRITSIGIQWHARMLGQNYILNLSLKHRMGAVSKGVFGGGGETIAYKIYFFVCTGKCKPFAKLTSEGFPWTIPE